MANSMKRLADKQVRKHRAIAKATTQATRTFIAWWYLFNERNDNYTHASDSAYPDLELKAQVDEYARLNGIPVSGVANNDELLTYAAGVFTAAAVSQIVSYTTDTLDTLVRETAALMDAIPDLGIVDELLDGVLWSDRIWSNQASLRSQLVATMKTALLTRDNPIVDSPKLRKDFGVLRYQSDRIIRTESSRVMSKQQLTNVKQAGYKKVVWVISSGACESCLQHSGNVYTLRDADGMIPLHPNCLCTWSAYTD